MKQTTFILSVVSMLVMLFYCRSSLQGETSSSGKTPVTTGSIEGKVTDHQGAPLAGATIAITNSRTKESITIKTDVDGAYRADRLAAGEYEVVISAAGLMTKTEKIRVKERHTSSVGAHLKPAASAAASAPVTPS